MRLQDRATFRKISARMRGQMSAAAAQSGVEFADFYDTSLHHDVCAKEPWVQGRVGSRQGAALHPLAAGQAALARQLRTVLSKQPASGYAPGPA